MHPIYNKLNTIVNDARLKNINNMTIKIILKEYLQNHILAAIYDNEDAKNLIFYGGTALRKIYNLDRMSEDLDFESIKEVNLKKIAENILDYFKKQKFSNVEYKIQEGSIIKRITFKFEVLHDLGLSPNESEKLHVKVEINPQPRSTALETQFSPFIGDQLSIMIKHYTLPVMMMGKIDACLNRVFEKGDSGIKVKGRDYYDLIWYMQQKIPLDETYLKEMAYTQKELFAQLDKKVSKIKSRDLLFDLQPFFMSINYIKSWTENFNNFYEEYSKFYKNK